MFILLNEMPQYGRQFSDKEIEILIGTNNKKIPTNKLFSNDLQKNFPINVLGRKEFLTYLREDILVKLIDLVCYTH